MGIDDSKIHLYPFLGKIQSFCLRILSYGILDIKIFLNIVEKNGNCQICIDAVKFALYNYVELLVKVGKCVKR